MERHIIQAHTLPFALPEIPGLEFSACLKPASLVGGDFYDVQPVEGGLEMMVGDVAGKGIPAARLTALMHATLKSEAQLHTRPADLPSPNQAVLTPNSRMDVESSPGVRQAILDVWNQGAKNGLHRSGRS